MIELRTILAPVDFSDASRTSFRCAVRLARRSSAAVHVVHAIDPLLATAASVHHIDIVSETRGELAAFCAETCLDGSNVTLHVTIGAAADASCGTADAIGADLIVVGARGLSGLNRVMMGTTTEQVIRRARRSVLTVPGRCPADEVTEWGPVIAATDEPERLTPPVLAAAAIAQRLDAPLHVVHVVTPLAVRERWWNIGDAVQHRRLEHARRTLEAVLHHAEGVKPANVHVATGAVTDTLAAEASRHSQALPILVLGRAEPGHGPAPGSVASRVIARAAAAVWVYLPPATPAS
jgi:universal stress protein A